MANAGAGRIGDYDRCAFLADGEGTFRPGPGANPAIGTRGEIEVVAETPDRDGAAPRPPRRGRSRRCGARTRTRSRPSTWSSWPPGRATAGGPHRHAAAQPVVAARRSPTRSPPRCPRPRSGARVSGDLDREVEVVAVAGGAGDFLLDDARAPGVDVYVTSDLRHHPASEFREHDGAPALIDVPHWAAEWTWLPVAADALLARDLDRRRPGVETEVSRICTDPWNYRAPGPATTPTSRSTPLKADPFAQLKLLDLQARRRAASTSSRTASNDLPEHAALAALAERRDRRLGRGTGQAQTEVERPRPRAAQGRRRRRAGEGPPRAQPASASTPAWSATPSSCRRCSTRSRRSSGGSATSRTRSWR